MANITVEYNSSSLVRPVTFKLFLPNEKSIDEKTSDGKYNQVKNTLFTLHGYTGASESWGLEELAAKTSTAIVMPNGENSFYLDGASTTRKYGTFLGEELPDYLRHTFGLAASKDTTGICGLSMGGFGAIHTALAYPNTFGKVGAMSSALIIHDIAHMKPGDDHKVANYDYYREIFGDLESVESSPANPETLVKEIQKNGDKLPEIFMCVGTEDFLLENNRQFHKFLTESGVEHIYEESSGDHDWGFWGRYAPKIFEWMFS